MSLLKAKEYLKQFNLNDNVLELDTSSATVTQAAIALGCTLGEIAKTLAFYVDNNKPILIVLAGDQKIDNKKFKLEFGTTAKLIPMEKVLKVVGHEVGGVCPFGIKNGIDVYLDVSLQKHEYVYPACGSASSAIMLTIEQLEQTSKFKKWVDVSKINHDII